MSYLYRPNRIAYSHVLAATPCGVHQKVPLPAILLCVVSVLRPKPVVPLNRPPRLLVQVFEAMGEDGRHRRPVFHTVLHPFVVPPRVRKPVPLIHAIKRQMAGGCQVGGLINKTNIQSTTQQTTNLHTFRERQPSSLLPSTHRHTRRECTTLHYSGGFPL